MKNLRDVARLHKKESTIVGIIVAVIFVFYFIFFFTMGMRFGGAFFNKSVEGGTTFYIGLINHTKADISVSTPKNGVTTVTYQLEGSSKLTYFVTVDAVEYTTKKYCSTEIKDENGKELFSGNFSKGYLFDKNGEPVFDERIKVNGSTDAEYTDIGDTLTASEVTKLALYQYDTIRGNPAFLIIAMFLFLFTIFDMMFPLAIFSMRHMIEVEDPQPSDWYLTAQKAGWSIGFALGLMLLSVALF